MTWTIIDRKTGEPIAASADGDAYETPAAYSTREQAIEAMRGRGLEDSCRVVEVGADGSYA